MQLARTLFIPSNQNKYLRKFFEIWIALWLQRKFTKQEILNLYIVSVRYDYGVMGLSKAIKHFYGDEVEAIQFVMRTNKRRNLTSSQWAAIAVEAEEIVEAIKQAVEVERRKKISERENVGNQYTEKVETCQLIDTPAKQPERAEQKIAQTFNTNRTYVNEAAKLKTERPEVFAQVKSGEKTITEAKREIKKEEQQERFTELKEKELQPPTGLFDVIVIDPPWKMEKIQREVAPLQVGFDYPKYSYNFRLNFVV
jgi:membrane peptidoglycan carboxypeptidase